MVKMQELRGKQKGSPSASLSCNGQEWKEQDKNGDENKQMGQQREQLMEG